MRMFGSLDRTSIAKTWRALREEGRQSPLVLAGAAALTMAAAAVGTVSSSSPSSLPGASSTRYTASSGAAVERLPPGRVVPLLGKEVHSATGDDIGRILEVLVDEWGRPRAVILGVGGFLGIGRRKVAIDWHALRFYTMNEHTGLLADLGPDRLKQAPAYKAAGHPVAVVEPSETTGWADSASGL